MHRISTTVVGTHTASEFRRSVAYGVFVRGFAPTHQDSVLLSAVYSNPASISSRIQDVEWIVK